MKSNFAKYVSQYFDEFIKNNLFIKQYELDDGQSYIVEFSTDLFVVKIEKYRKEFYVTLYKIGYSDEEINLFNLIQYLNKDASKDYKPKYFSKESNADECYRKQLQYISNQIYENYSEIRKFFSSENYEFKFNDVKRFMIEKYPDLFKKI
jgi:hypothetical protein